jgi:hypothetical protein
LFILCQVDGLFFEKGYTRMQIPSLQLEGVKDFAAGCLNWISLNVFQNVDVWLVEDDKEIKAQLLKFVILILSCFVSVNSNNLMLKN